ncbi:MULTISPECIES: RHS repeat domain-containing protein [unclassified Maridesulfovibrio]|uniref:RHS repeat domain-containing protein n=1 Tax=unclassified Maridesulfovibrio TaxID=2794999 RepID=UPI003B3D3B7E
MSFRNDFRLRPKSRKELGLALRMYGENEEPHLQIENMWEVYSPSTGMALLEPKPDFSEFSRGDRMYPSMMKPETKIRWEQKNKEWEIEKERYVWRKRLAHLRFMRENQDLPLVQALAQTDYGKSLVEEFSARQPQQPQTGTGENLHDEFERDGVEFDPESSIRVTPFTVPGMEEPFSVLATARDEDGRIVEKLCSLEPKDHHVHYDYDAGGRLCAVWKDERLIEEYKYGKQGERYFGSTPQTGQCRFTYGPGLRLERAGEVKYSYDGDGRLVMKQDGLDVTNYEYHHSGQLQQVNLPDGRRISYVIDPQGRRMAKSVNGKVMENYSWHDFTTLAVAAFEDGSRMEFAYDEEGDPVVMRYNEKVYFLASDQVGTIYMVANKDGHEVKRIIRDSFGNLIVDTNERMNIPVGFAGGLYDRDTGLVHFGHREYDPSCGRFITPDRIGIEGGDVDVYGYCHDDPVNFVDRGRSKKDSEKKEVNFMDDLK